MLQSTLQMWYWQSEIHRFVLNCHHPESSSVPHPENFVSYQGSSALEMKYQYLKVCKIQSSAHSSLSMLLGGMLLFVRPWLLHSWGPIMCHTEVETAILIPLWPNNPNNYAWSFLFINVLNFQFYLLTVYWEKERQTLQEMRRDSVIQRCVFVDEWTIMSGCICPFQNSCLQYSHLQKLCSHVLSLSSPLRPTSKQSCGDVIMRILCLCIWSPQPWCTPGLPPSCGACPVYPAAVVHPWCTFQLWLWTSKCLTDTFSERQTKTCASSNLWAR